MSKEICKNCKWWERYEIKKGRCCRYPPAVVQEEDSKSYVGRWPGSFEDNSCGEFKAKE